MSGDWGKPQEVRLGLTCHEGNNVAWEYKDKDGGELRARVLWVSQHRILESACGSSWMYAYLCVIRWKYGGETGFSG